MRDTLAIVAATIFCMYLLLAEVAVQEHTKRESLAVNRHSTPHGDLTTKWSAGLVSLGGV